MNKADDHASSCPRLLTADELRRLSKEMTDASAWMRQELKKRRASKRTLKPDRDK